MKKIRTSEQEAEKKRKLLINKIIVKSVIPVVGNDGPYKAYIITRSDKFYKIDVPHQNGNLFIEKSDNKRVQFALENNNKKLNVEQAVSFFTKYPFHYSQTATLELLEWLRK